MKTRVRSGLLYVGRSRLRVQGSENLLCVAFREIAVAVVVLLNSSSSG